MKSRSTNKNDVSEPVAYCMVTGLLSD
jgi:hypothetical protein